MFSMVMGIKQKVDAVLQYDRKFIECEQRGKFSLGNNNAFCD